MTWKGKTKGQEELIVLWALWRQGETNTFPELQSHTVKDFYITTLPSYDA